MVIDCPAVFIKYNTVEEERDLLENFINNYVFQYLEKEEELFIINQLENELSLEEIYNKVKNHSKLKYNNFRENNSNNEIYKSDPHSCCIIKLSSPRLNNTNNYNSEDIKYLIRLLRDSRHYRTHIICLFPEVGSFTYNLFPLQVRANIDLIMTQTVETDIKQMKWYSGSSTTTQSIDNFPLWVKRLTSQLSSIFDYNFINMN